MRRSKSKLAYILAPLLLWSSYTYGLEAQKLEVSKPGDLQMSCDELKDEVLLMNEIISTTQSIKDQKNIEKTGVTALGALGSFLVGTATGGIGIAAAGFVLKENLEGYEDNADEIQDVAEQRQTFVSGIYKAKQCTKPLIEEESIVNVRAEKLISIEPASGQKNDRTSFLNN